MSHCLFGRVGKRWLDVRPLLTPSCRFNYAVFRLANCQQLFSYSLQMFICIFRTIDLFYSYLLFSLFLEVNKTSLFGIALVSLSNLVGRIPNTWGDHAGPSQQTFRLPTIPKRPKDN